jgi:GT2 family glycosyltransferase
VIVVDDGSSDGTSAILGTRSLPFALRSIRQENAGPAKARNAGLHAARGELLLFLDDDVVPSEELVAEHLRSHEAEQDVVVMGPLASLPHYRQPWVSWEQAKLEEQYTAMMRGDWEPTFRQFWTGNASVSRERVALVGGFDTTLLRAEDVELGLRLHQLGMKFRFNPRAKGFHHAERSLGSWESAHRHYGRLEVGILGKQGDDALLRTLCANWRAVHPATRLVVRGCLPSARRQEVVRALLRGLLLAQEALGAQIASDQVCGVLANLLYWSESTRELGPERTAQVLGSSES